MGNSNLKNFCDLAEDYRRVEEKRNFKREFLPFDSHLRIFFFVFENSFIFFGPLYFRKVIIEGKDDRHAASYCPGCVLGLMEMSCLQADPRWSRMGASTAGALQF